MYLQLRAQQNRKDSLEDMIISNRPKQLNRRSSVTRMSIDEKEKLVHSSSMEERGTALTDRITEDSEQGKIVVFIEERHVNSGIIFSCFGNTQWCFYNTHSKSYCLFNTQSRVVQYCSRRQLLTFKVPIAQMKLRLWIAVVNNWKSLITLLESWKLTIKHLLPQNISSSAKIWCSSFAYVINIELSYYFIFWWLIIICPHFFI